jgi:hypothetical protein
MTFKPTKKQSNTKIKLIIKEKKQNENRKERVN